METSTPSARSGLYERIRQKLRRISSNRLARRIHAFQLDRPIISFTFDDFPKNAATTGAEILEAQGCRGTYFTSFGLMRRMAPTGLIFDQSDLPKLLAAQHELGCHTFAHCHAWETSTATFMASVEENARVLRQAFPAASFSTLSYPISCPRPAIKRECAKRFKVCRAGGQGFNAGAVDLNAANSFFLERSRGNLAEVERLIEENSRANGWLIFSTHDIAGDPTPYGCRPGFFTSVVDSAVKSGARILPMGEAFDLIQSAG